jgi:twinkle protein
MTVTEKQILEQCANHGITLGDVRRTRSHVIIKECPFCDKPTNNKADNQYKLYVAVGGGAYFCHRCGSKGSWYDFKMKLGGYEVVGMDGASEISNTRGRTKATTESPSSYASRTSFTTPCLPMPSQRLAAIYISRLLDEKVESPVLEYLTNVRGLLKTTLRKYGVGRATYNFPSKEQQPGSQPYVPAECVTFPWIMRASQVAEQEELRGASYEYKSSNDKDCDDDDANEDPCVTRRIKARAFQEKSWQRLDPPGGGWGLFGFHTVPQDATEIVITEGEYDAMAVYQGTGRPAVSLPNGCRSLPVEVLPLLEKFEKIYLWMDNDAPGQEGAEKFCKKFGRNRCYIVKPEHPSGERVPKDANEALLMGLDMNEFLDNAKQVPHDRILTFEELRAQVLHEIMHPEKYVGIPVPSLPVFTSLIKGFRRGEITVMTGPTGSGKTTFLGQLSLDFAEQGVNTLWGSFEIKNTRLMHKLLQQFSREPLPVGKPESIDSLNALADRFQNLPMYFMKFHGGSDIDDVLDAMDFAVYVNDVEHIILDNMQFMLSRNTAGGSSFDKFDIQDIAIEKFRKFATEHDVHVTLVCHPKKEEEGARLGINSVYGSAKATQEADTVLILQNDGRRKFIEVKKNRFDGTLGMSPLFFDRKSGRYTESPDLDPNQQQRTVKPVPVLSPPGGKIQARALSSRSPRASSTQVSDEEIDNHWDSMLENSQD